jgi:hypothetical protein
LTHPLPAEGSAFCTPILAGFEPNPGQIAPGLQSQDLHCHSPGLESQDLHRHIPDLFLGVVMAVPIPASLIVLPAEPGPDSVWDASGAVLVPPKDMGHGLSPVDLGLVDVCSHVADALHVPLPGQWEVLLAHPEGSAVGTPTARQRVVLPAKPLPGRGKCCWHTQREVLLAHPLPGRG